MLQLLRYEKTDKVLHLQHNFLFYNNLFHQGYTLSFFDIKKAQESTCAFTI
jgi:hypothetical protein